MNEKRAVTSWVWGLQASSIRSTRRPKASNPGSSFRSQPLNLVCGSEGPAEAEAEVSVSPRPEVRCS